MSRTTDVAQDGERRAHVLVFVLPQLSESELRQLYGLSPAQARVAQFLFHRRTNHEIADALHITIHTVRRHVEAVLLKLQVKKRWDVEYELGRAVAARSSGKVAPAAR